MKTNLKNGTLPPGILSAINGFPMGAPPANPSVTIIVPLRNEVAHVDLLVKNILTQNYPYLIEILLIDGMSTDGTWEALEKLQKIDSRLRLLRNPALIQSAALNLGVAEVKSDIIMRMDAHARYDPSVVSVSVSLLLNTGAAGVGPKVCPLSLGNPLSKSIAAVLQNKVGAGAAKFRCGYHSDWVDTIWNGSYWTYIAQKVGKWREDFARLEDNDFNYRVRTLGYGLYCSVDIPAYYYPRQTLKGLWRQYSDNGADVVKALFCEPQILMPRHLGPLVFLVTMLGLLIVGIFWFPAFLAGLAFVFSYLALIFCVSTAALLKQPGVYAMLMPIVFFTVHLGYGMGSLLELCRRPFQRSQNPVRKQPF